MPSPFPGMNPYIEHDIAWHDFHGSFMPLARELLNAQLVPRYITRIEESVYIQEPETQDREFLGRADLAVIEATGPAATATASRAAGVRVLQPVLDEERLSHLEIVDRKSQQVVTVIELLSPTNKRLGPNRRQYLSKQAKILFSDSHLVEIDLLRGGPRMPWRTIPACDYCIVTSRAESRPGAVLTTVRLRESLPTIPIPVSAGDADASLDLQAILHRVYDSAAYGYYIYETPPEPSLSEADQAWAEEILGSKKS